MNPYLDESLLSEAPKLDDPLSAARLAAAASPLATLSMGSSLAMAGAGMADQSDEPPEPVVTRFVFVDPVREVVEHRVDQIGLFQPLENLLGMSAEEKLLHLFIHAGRRRHSQPVAVSADGVVGGGV